MAVLSIGSKGSEVSKLADLLMKHGYLSTKTDVFSLDVFHAVQAFQSAHVDSRDRPLVVDGNVGPLTWWALEHDDISHIVVPGVLPLNPHADPGATLATVAIRVAVEEMNAGAKEIGGNNSGPYVEKYIHGLAGTPNNWCAAFVSFCYYTASKRLGVPMPFNYSLGAKDIYRQFEKKGWTYAANDGRPPQPGDIIVWHRGSLQDWTGHIGLVQSYEHGIVTTIEGNKGSFPANVRPFTYTLGEISKLYGFGHCPL